jgi:hypothetical protein
MSSFNSWFFLLLQIPFSSWIAPKIFLNIFCSNILNVRMYQTVLYRVAHTGGPCSLSFQCPIFWHTWRRKFPMLSEVRSVDSKFSGRKWFQSHVHPLFSPTPLVWQAHAYCNKYCALAWCYVTQICIISFWWKLPAWRRFIFSGIFLDTIDSW